MLHCINANFGQKKAEPKDLRLFFLLRFCIACEAHLANIIVGSENSIQFEIGSFFEILQYKFQFHLRILLWVRERPGSCKRIKE